MGDRLKELRERSQKRKQLLAQAVNNSENTFLEIENVLFPQNKIHQNTKKITFNYFSKNSTSKDVYNFSFFLYTIN